MFNREEENKLRLDLINKKMQHMEEEHKARMKVISLEEEAAIIKCMLQSSKDNGTRVKHTIADVKNAKLFTKTKSSRVIYHSNRKNQMPRIAEKREAGSAAERFKLSAIGSVPFRRKKQIYQFRSNIVSRRDVPQNSASILVGGNNGFFRITGWQLEMTCKPAVKEISAWMEFSL
uniref:Uncharacterized protein n=1 Tax=Romanomermis culicivorax TaxID=13658 RepID=A0A915ISB3_ROMCU